MLFASDLDQTLIYSPRSFRLNPEQQVPPISLVEIYNGQEISFIADNALVKLKALAAQSVFIPVTTRTVEQYRRILLFKEELMPPCAVVSNGGNIVVKDRIDQDWNRHIRARVDQECLAAPDVLKRFQEIGHESWLFSPRQADDLFYYYLVERNNVPEQELASFTAWADSCNWKVSLQGRKLYLVPGVVNKWEALVAVRQLLGEEFTAAAGDSLMDVCILEQADYAIAPCHGEIWDNRATLAVPFLNFTKQPGIFAAEEILNGVLRLGMDSDEETASNRHNF